MRIQELIAEVKTTLVETFTEVDAWFEKPISLKDYRPLDNGWTIQQILEHISLTNYFLLELIDKGALKAKRNLHNFNLEEALKNFSFEKEKLDEIGIHKSFDWVRPDHMEPTGEMRSEEARVLVSEQKNRCFEQLANMPNGEGIAHKTTMSVNNLGKINVYEYIYFLAKHAQRHITQMRKNEAEYRKENSST